MVLLFGRPLSLADSTKFDGVWLTFEFDILSNLVRDFGTQPFLVCHFLLHIRPW